MDLGCSATDPFPWNLENNPLRLDWVQQAWHLLAPALGAVCAAGTRSAGKGDC